MPSNLDTFLADPQVTAIIRIALAGLVAGLIGLERELAGKAAGIRTYGLVGIGSAMFTVTAIYGFGNLDYASRIVGGVITGIGFLGAGAILHTRMHIVGLTTAAGLWVAAGVGLAMGAGLYVIGIGAGVLLFILLQFAGPEEFIRERRRRRGLKSIDPEDDFDAIDESDDADQRVQPTPRPVPAPQPQTMYAGPASIPAPPAYGPWSTATQQGPPQVNGRG
jgi:putative Mg2+ transporter-C (MgtC) family protein